MKAIIDLVGIDGKGLGNRQLAVEIISGSERITRIVTTSSTGRVVVDLPPNTKILKIMYPGDGLYDSAELVIPVPLAKSKPPATRVVSFRPEYMSEMISSMSAVMNMVMTMYMSMIIQMVMIP